MKASVPRALCRLPFIVLAHLYQAGDAISLREARHVLSAHTACEQEKKKQPELTRAHTVPRVVHCPIDHSVIVLIRKDVQVLREEIHQQLKSSE